MIVGICDHATSARTSENKSILQQRRDAGASPAAISGWGTMQAGRCQGVPAEIGAVACFEGSVVISMGL